MHTAAALQTLSARRFALTARTPRQILVPLLTPIMFALVIAPALKEALGGLGSHIDYTAFVAVGTVGLLVPLTAMFAGLSVIVDRDSGAQRELLAAPIPRGLLVIGNLVVALSVAALQVVVLIAVATARGAKFHPTAAGIVWFVIASVLFTVFMYGMAETLDPAVFMRVHRSVIVRLDRIDTMRRSSGGDYAVRLKDGTELSVSRARREALEQRLGVS